ncbi:efflux RND transporter permease subunit [Flavobacterium sp.]|uniref:efflux RND transporter permease subunit n=1 Tax=Flavobacterium sp. TaxID=239 RepID=UPI0037531232
MVAFQYAGNFKFGNAFLEKNLNELKLKLPLGYKFEKETNLWDFNEEKKSNYIYLLFLIIVLIYFICSILFESLTQPLIILSVIPISFIGIFVIFYLFDFNFDQGGFASFVLLSGISVNSSIFLLNEFNYIKKEKIELNVVQVFILAYKNKIIPIGMTVLSTIFGFLPFVINGQSEVFWFALAIGAIGGLLFTIIAITFFLPIFCIKKK